MPKPLTSRQRFGLGLSRFVGGDYLRTVTLRYKRLAAKQAAIQSLEAAVFDTRVPTKFPHSL